MLIFTNRMMTTDPAPPEFTRKFQPGAETLAVAKVNRVPGGGFSLADPTPQIGDDDAVRVLVSVFSGVRPVLVYLHGNNNSPEACFERCARLDEIYGLEVVGFSWASEGYLSSGDELPMLAPEAAASDSSELGLASVSPANRKDDRVQNKIRRYRQAKQNAQDSSDALARFFRLLAVSRLYANHQPMTIAAHSLGSHFLQYTIETETAAESLAAAQNIVLLAACCRADGHAGWVSKLSPKSRTYVTYNRNDLVLFGAWVADNKQVKLGTEPGDRIVSPKVRYVSLTNSQTDLSGHSYFVRDTGKQMPKAHKRLFGRIFAGENDIDIVKGEHPNAVYPTGCDADGSTCYMARPEQIDPNLPNA